MNDKKIKIIADNNKVIILKFIELLCKWFNLTEEKIKEMPKEHLKFHIRNALTRVKVDEYKLSQLLEEIEEKSKLIEEFEKAYVSSNSYDGIGEGKNTGGSNTPPDIRQIKKIQMKEEQADRIIAFDEAQKRIKEKHEILKQFIELMPQAHYVVIMKLLYFEHTTMRDISKKVHYEPNSIKQINRRAMIDLANLVKSYFTN